jgi:aspartyl-tRNA(Asn)/glutamyl-tRNA(Gln) amidotransferase subunit A
MGSSLDQIGSLAKTVEDARILYEAIRGHDPMDSQTLSASEEVSAKFGEGESQRENSLAEAGGRGDPRTFSQLTFSGTMRVGVPRHLLEKGVDAGVLEAFNTTLNKLEAAGHTIVDIELPSSEYALAAYYVVMPAEVSTNLARLDGIRYGLAKRGDTLLSDYVLSRTEGFGEETRRRILLGTFVLSSGYIDAYYRKAQASRDLLRKEYEAAFRMCDVIAFPTTLSEAFAFGAKADPVSMYLEDIFTVTANLTGMPAISVPMGLVNNLPVGIHFTAPHNGEERLFAVSSIV